MRGLALLSGTGWGLRARGPVVLPRPAQVATHGEDGRTVGGDRPWGLGEPTLKQVRGVAGAVLRAEHQG